MTLKIKRYSGLRLNASTPQYRAEFDKMVSMAFLVMDPIITAAKNELYLYQDHFKHLPNEMLVRGMIENGEIYVLEWNDELAGYAAIRQCLVGLHGKFEIYLYPQFRKGMIWKEIRSFFDEYFWKPIPEGLGLVKLKASTCDFNKAVKRAATLSGFKPMAYLQAEALFNGQQAPIIYWERHNPKLGYGLPDELEVSHGKQRTVNTPEQSTSEPVGVSGDGPDGLPVGGDASVGPVLGDNVTNTGKRAHSAPKRVRARKSSGIRGLRIATKSEPVVEPGSPAERGTSLHGPILQHLLSPIDS